MSRAMDLDSQGGLTTEGATPAAPVTPEEIAPSIPAPGPLLPMTREALAVIQRAVDDLEAIAVAKRSIENRHRKAMTDETLEVTIKVPLMFEVEEGSRRTRRNNVLRIEHRVLMEMLEMYAQRHKSSAERLGILLT